MEAYREFLKSDRWEEWQNDETDQKKGMPPPPVQKPCPKDATLINLIAPDDLTVGQMSVIEAIGRRRSRREFTEEPLTLEELSFLLWATQGIDEEATQVFREWLAGVMDIDVALIPSVLRTVPSGGACHPFETYLIVSRVSGLEPGLYRYLSVEHKLLFLRADTGLTAQVADAVAGWAANSAVVFVWTAVPYRTEWRYSIVSHKMIAQESGHLCQNLYLASEAIGAGTCVVGAYDQAKVDVILDIDGKDEFAIAVVPAGKIAP
jgi:SagB-type dehydrogenase family enzyme